MIPSPALRLAAMLLALAGCGKGAGKDAPARPAAAEPGTFRATPEQYAGLTIATVGAPGPAAGAQASGVIAVDGDLSTPVFPPYSGLVTRVFVDPGQRVREGDPLLQVRASEFVDARDALFAASAARQTAFSQLRVATTNAGRAQEIYRTAGGALKDAQAAENDLAVARAGVRTAEAALGQARDKLAIMGKTPREIARLEAVTEVVGIHAETKLHAPIGGVVATRAVSVGQYIHAGDAVPAFTITDPKRVWLIAQLPEGDAARVHVGDAVTVTTPAYPGRTFRARVDNIAASLDPATHRLPVRATIANADGALKPQMFASFTIASNAPDPGGVTVPAAAIIHEGDSARVWVAEPGRVLRARAVRLGDGANGMVRVTQGLRDGERIVTAGALFVNEAGSPS